MAVRQSHFEGTPWRWLEASGRLDEAVQRYRKARLGYGVWTEGVGVYSGVELEMTEWDKGVIYLWGMETEEAITYLEEVLFLVRNEAETCVDTSGTVKLAHSGLTFDQLLNSRRWA